MIAPRFINLYICIFGISIFIATKINGQFNNDLNYKEFSLLENNLNYSNKIFASNNQDPKSHVTNQFQNIISSHSKEDNNGSESKSIGFDIPSNVKMTVRNFYLFTKDYRKGIKYEILDPLNESSIISSHFENRKTYVVIHGFIGYGLEAWILSLKDALLLKENCNVISVDWPAGSRWFLPTYVQAAGRVTKVGNNTAFLLSLLKKNKGLLLENVHCIGHSLGGHSCGFMGKPFLGRIGRISGLDPAGPRFHGLNSSYRLDKKDAVYVDVIHTNGCDFDYWLVGNTPLPILPDMDCYGLNENIGHSDFYPNGGKHQPGCPSRFVKTVGGDIGCDHKMAYSYFIESLNYPKDSTYFLARPCDSWENYTNDICPCGKHAQFMGFSVNTELDGVFYVETESSPPYAETDPFCSDSIQWNFLVIIGYVMVTCFGVSLIACIVIIVLRNVRKCFISQEAGEEDITTLISDVEASDQREEEVPNNIQSENH